MEEIVKYIVLQLVEFPSDVKISLKENDEQITIYVNVNSKDLGQVIGKKGRTASSIRTIVRSTNSGQNKRIYVKFNEKEQ